MNISSHIARRFVRVGLLGFLTLLLVACNAGGSGSSPGPSGNQQPPAQTSVPTPTVAAGTITEFPLSTMSPSVITAGPDGNLWFDGVDDHGNPALIRMTPTGSLTPFRLPSAIASVNGITAGPDGNLWFTMSPFDSYSKAYIGRITPTGTATEFTSQDGAAAITTGPDHNLWFINQNQSNPTIIRMTPTGTITKFPLGPDMGGNVSNSSVGMITAGPDGNLWFTEPDVSQIGRMTPSGSLTEFPITSKAKPQAITAGPDGNLWFTESDADTTYQIGQITGGKP